MYVRMYVCKSQINYYYPRLLAGLMEECITNIDQDILEFVCGCTYVCTYVCVYITNQLLLSQVAGGPEFLGETLDDLMEECITNIDQDPTFQTDLQARGVAKEVKDLSCSPADCHGNGKCVEGENPRAEITCNYVILWN